MKAVDLGDGTFGQAVSIGGSTLSAPSELIAEDEYTATQDSPDQPSDGNAGLYATLHVTDVPGSAPSLQLLFVVTDPVTGEELTLNQAQDGVEYDPITDEGVYHFNLGPGCWAEDVGNIYQATPTAKPPGAWKVRIVHDNANAVTYELSGGSRP